MSLRKVNWRRRTAFWVCISLLCLVPGVLPATAAASTPAEQWITPQGALLIKGEPASPGNAAIVAIMLAGSASQRAEETHAAHIAEHMVFQNREAGAPSLTDRVAEWGGTLNGHTGLQYTSFQVVVPEDHVLDAISELLRALFVFEYDPEVYQRELEGYLRVELHQMTTRYPTALHNAWRRHFFQGSDYAEDIFAVDITQARQSTVSAWQQREYGANRLVLVVTSTAAWEDIKASTEIALQQAPPTAPPASFQEVRLSPPPAATASIPGAPEGLVSLGLCVDQIEQSDREELILLLELIKQQMRFGGSILQLRALPELSLISWQGGTAYLQLAWRPSGLRPHEPDPEGAQLAQLQAVVERYAAGDIGLGDLRLLQDDGEFVQAPQPNGVLAEAWALAEEHLPDQIQAVTYCPPGTEPETLLLRLQAVASRYLPHAQLTRLQINGAAPVALGRALVVPTTLLMLSIALGLLVRAMARQNHKLKVFLALVIVTLKSTLRPGRDAGSEENRNRQSLLRFVAAILLLVVSFHLSELLVQVCLQLGQPELLFVLASTALAILLVLYGGYMLLSVFLWSRDRQLLLALPLSSAQIVLARLVVVALSQYPLAFLFLFPPVLKYSTYMGGHPTIWLTAVAVALLLPIFALTLVALPIVAAIGYITPRLREHLTLLWSVLMALVTVSLRIRGGLGSGQVGMHSLLISWLQLRQVELTNTIGRFFPPAIWAGRALVFAGETGGWANLGLLTLAAAACLWLLYRLSLRCYLGGADERSEVRQSSAVRDLGRTATPGRALFMREWRTFWRTPALLAITLPNLFVPLLAFYPLLRGLFRGQGLAGMANWLRGSSGQSLLPALLAGAIAMLVMVSSRLASISISREGSQLYFSKMIPVDYASQLRAKLLHVLIVNGLCLAPVLTAAFIWLRLSLLSSLLALLAAALGLLVSSLICIRHDLSAPRLDWDNPQALLRGSSNLGSVLTMLLALAATAWLTFAMLRRGWPMLLIFLLVAAGYAAFGWLSYRSLLRQADQLYDDIPL
ncbi:MAG: insulinase family protein [Bacillota bacterium]